MSEFRHVDFDKSHGLYIQMAGYEDVPALACWGPGKRQYHILHFVTKGSGFFCGKKVCAGEGFYIHPELLQEYHSSEDDPWNYFWLIFSEDIAKKYVVPLLCPDKSGVFKYRSGYDFTDAANAFFSENKDTVPHFKALSLFFSLMDVLTKGTKSAVCLPLMHIRGAKGYIENNLNKKLSVRDVADSVHINDRYLYNIFLRYEGITPKSYIDSCKISAAKELLSHTDMTVSQAAYSVGFDDVCVFSKFFSKNTGKSPSAFRSEIQKTASE